MRLILLGSPGAGKGTQAKLISAKYHIPQISTGDIFRAAIQNQSELGKQVKKIVDEGQLVPDDIVIKLVEERIQKPDCSNGFLLDGFPRTVAQAKALNSLTAIDYVIDIDVPHEEIIKRLTGRRIHPASGRIYHILHNPPKVEGKDDVTGESLIQRPDDSEQTVKHRLKVYQDQTSPLRDFYQHGIDRSGPLYVHIDGTGTVEQINEKISSVLKKASDLSSIS